MPGVGAHLRLTQIAERKQHNEGQSTDAAHNIQKGAHDTTNGSAGLAADINPDRVEGYLSTGEVHCYRTQANVRHESNAIARTSNNLDEIRWWVELQEDRSPTKPGGGIECQLNI